MRRYRFWFIVRLLLTSLPFMILAIGLVVAAMSAEATVVKEWKEVILIFGTGIITFSAAYVGASMENLRERERGVRQARKERVAIYRDYLAKVMGLVQRVELAAGFYEKDSIDQYNRVRIKEKERDEMLLGLPPIQEFSAIEDEDTRKAVDSAILVGIGYWNESADSRPEKRDLQVAFQAALNKLDYYENLL